MAPQFDPEFKSKVLQSTLDCVVLKRKLMYNDQVLATLHVNNNKQKTTASGFMFEGQRYIRRGEKISPWDMLPELHSEMYEDGKELQEMAASFETFKRHLKTFVTNALNISTSIADIEILIPHFMHECLPSGFRSLKAEHPDMRTVNVTEAMITTFNFTNEQYLLELKVEMTERLLQGT